MALCDFCHWTCDGECEGARRADCPAAMPKRFRLATAHGRLVEVVWHPSGLEILEDGKRMLFSQEAANAVEYIDPQRPGDILCPHAGR